MMSRKSVLLGGLFVTTFVATISAQAPRPANVPFYTWVREDTFAGLIDGDFARLEQGERKTQDYLLENPQRNDAANWLGATKIIRAVKAFRDGQTASGDAMLRDGLKAMDEAITRAPNDLGLRAPAGGTLMYLASQLPEQHYQGALQRAREHYAALYRVQAPALAQLPLHIKGELLAGVAETEFRIGDRERGVQLLNQIVSELPGTGYARTAATWLSAPDNVGKDARLVCQSCHEPGRLSSWMARQPKTP
jgi:hypothetical protein